MPQQGDVKSANWVILSLFLVSFTKIYLTAIEVSSSELDMIARLFVSDIDYSKQIMVEADEQKMSHLWHSTSI